MLKGFEFINCPLCGRDDSKLKFTAKVQPHQKGYFSFDEWNIVQCGNCGLIYVNPRITEDVNQKYYQFNLDGDLDFIEQHFIEAADYRSSYWERMVRVVQKYQKSGDLLDIGCGNGAFLIAARNAGFKVFGQDISEYFIQYNEKENGITVYNGELAKLNLQKNSFDVITCFDIIEHHFDPKALLSEIKRLLKPDGILVISTHDIGNIFAKFYGSKWRMIYPIGHLIYFSRKTMRKILSSTGYDVIRITGGNKIDDNTLKENANVIQSIFKTLIFRILILLIYKPFMRLFPSLSNWKIKYKNTNLTHDLVLFITGDQVISNDELVAIARPNR